MAAVGWESPLNGLNAGSEVELKGNVGLKTLKKKKKEGRESLHIDSTLLTRQRRGLVQIP